jgi:YVTN family beta-propeller protein
MVAGGSQAEAAEAPRKIAYLTNDGSTLRVLDLATGVIALDLPGFQAPSSVAVTADGVRAYVTNSAGTTVSVLDTATNTVTATVTGLAAPQVVVIAPDGRHAYVSNQGAGTVSVLDTGSDTVTATVPVGAAPTGVAVSPNGSRVYVANFFGRTVSVIDAATNAVIATVPVGNRPTRVAVSPDGSRAYVTNRGSTSVSVLDTATNTVTATIPVGTWPHSVAFTQDGSRAYVTNEASSSVSVIDTASNTVTATIAVGSPRGLTFTADGSRLYVANLGGVIVEIDPGTNKVVHTTGVGGAPTGLSFASAIPTGPTAHLSVTVFNSAVDADWSGSTPGWFYIYRTVFDFGDGTVVQSPAPTLRHMYEHGGTYTVRLTVTNPLGLTDTVSQQVTIRQTYTTLGLLAPSDQRYVTAEGAGTTDLWANRTAIGLWEQFDLIDIDGTNVALRARVNGNFVKVYTIYGAMTPGEPGIDDRALFQLVHNPDGTVSLLARAVGKYVSGNNGTMYLTADRATIGPSIRYW